MIAYCQGKAFVTKRGLSPEDRHAVIDGLAAMSLVTPDEAAELHRRVGEGSGGRQDTGNA